MSLLSKSLRLSYTYLVLPARLVSASRVIHHRAVNGRAADDDDAATYAHDVIITLNDASITPPRDTLARCAGMFRRGGGYGALHDQDRVLRHRAEHGDAAA